ncbi:MULTISPECIES: hypothetical protein [Bifidobacterium]|uniref:Uncharacterized protein n=3 Tax=Bifidobacterium TaxID=1678 RepID=A0A7K1J749_9BIFI|nr:MULTISPECIES: hypothetical protein [Bifidobacterium]KFI63021.1 hypothetical protein BCUN_0854 [Bifidobacterium cuniculi]MUH60359.1 hypothetical protein [Bifidobacterium canis]RYQ22861.1 hypothetical protein PG2049B_1043 [Bifidobacterium pseudolongum subsp. globosum]RYQ31199.1 hypothetical protein PG2017B_1009 [Bifidobacterium pseudolongum subsp. globosum]
MVQSRRPKGSPNGTGGQFAPDATGPMGTPPTLTSPTPAVWPEHGEGVVSRTDLRDMTAREVLALDWSNINMHQGDLRGTGVTPLDLPYDPEDGERPGPVFSNTFFGDTHGQYACYTRYADGDVVATLTQPHASGTDPAWDGQLVVCDKHDMPVLYDEHGDGARRSYSAADLAWEVDQWRAHERTLGHEVRERDAARLTDALDRFLDGEHGVWRNTDIPANMDTVAPTWLDEFQTTCVAHA